MKKLAKDLYVFHDSCNVYVIKNGNNVVLIDFGTGGVLEHLQDVNIAAILITHHHRDQLQGLSKVPGIPVYVPHSEQDLIHSADEHWQSREILNNYNNRQDRFSILNSTPIAGTLKDYSRISLGGMDLTVIPTPGHTVGSISLLHEEACFTGDLFYAPGKLWSLAATQWSYNGGEGLPYTVLSLLNLKDIGAHKFYPSHGSPMTPDAIDPTVNVLLELLRHRRHNSNLLELYKNPYQYITPHVLHNCTSESDSYVLVSKSGKGLIIDYGYDFMAGFAHGVDRSARRPWAYTIPWLVKNGITPTTCIPTHYHDDHVAGMNLLRDTYGVEVICPEIFADIMENPDAYDLPCLWYDSISIDRRVGESFIWEEYEIKTYPLPGHTLYAVAIVFTVDGKTFLCGGDQYAHPDGLECNYVYKNKFSQGDFVKTAKLYNRIFPDYLLTGHWGALEYTTAYGESLLARGEEICSLHSRILPHEDFGNSFTVEFKPFHKKIDINDSFTAVVYVTNPFDTESEVKLEMHIPNGFQVNGGLTATIPSRGTVCFPMEIHVSYTPQKRTRISCDLIMNGVNMGQQGEMLVSIK
ncbi:MAG: MBL fold metallo-hydrolase [Defluviitaleaceae bacterium]|nr:MBL fold metallo-hydrolase [Defluviitaleaceae bacterium]